ncbi:hypothetical protein [Sphingobacterium faecium]|uniref:hypothetical protein n=1 Tax=Sphingobacterium faecium TaxID=34087 RepID=UPI00247984DD|nr:hypothetical protein [Sphingobacterium faecium]WGQ15047.1 hypothetical protein QG727_01260 [Sphingobacterium faecium]
MKIKLIITAMLFILFSTLRAQDVILGEKNPCPEETYEYIFNGISCDGNLTWSVNHGTVIQTTSNRIKISWHKDFVGNGSWHVRAHFSRQKSDGSCDVSSYHELPIKVNAVSAFNIIGDREIPGGFRGTKTYTAQIKNTLFPASSYLWAVFSGGTLTNYTTTVPSFNLNITDDGPKWISVQGKNSTCSSWGQSIKADIFTTTTFTGPDNLCSEATYTLINPGTVTLENASGIATLTALGNNQWMVTRTGQANGTIKLTSTLNGIKSTKDIKIGAIINGEISGISTIFPGKYHDYTLILNDNIANYQNITFGIPDGMTMQILANNKVRLTAERNYVFAPGETEHTVTLNVTATILGCGIASIEFPITVINPNPTPIN